MNITYKLQKLDQATRTTADNASLTVGGNKCLSVKGLALVGFYDWFFVNC